MTTRDDAPRRRSTRDELFDVLREHGQLTRPDLSALTGIPRSTVNQSLELLFREGRIVEVDAAAKQPGSGRGRPATVVRAVAAGAAVAGVDFGHRHVNVAIGDEVGTILDVESVVLDVDLHADEALDVAEKLLTRLRKRHDHPELSAVVAGIPGPVDQQTGRVCSPTILSGWVGLAPAEELGRRIGTAVHIENDAVLGAYGELMRGSGRGYRDFLYVKASHGIGAGLVIGGQPYRGGTGLAGEIGHTLLPGRSELCRCGNRGCLEAVVSVPSVRAQIAHTRPGVDPESVDLADLGDDPIAARILHTAGRTLGHALADLANLLNPPGPAGSNSPGFLAGAVCCGGSPAVLALGSTMGGAGCPAWHAGVAERRDAAGHRARPSHRRWRQPHAVAAIGERGSPSGPRSAATDASPDPICVAPCRPAAVSLARVVGQLVSIRRRERDLTENS